MRALVSLAPKRRLIADSARSPACATNDSRAPAAANRSSDPPGTAREYKEPTIELAKSAPTKPDHVLLGETRGHSFGPPNNLPDRKPAVSETTTMTTRKTTASSPSSASERSQINATAGRPA